MVKSNDSHDTRWKTREVSVGNVPVGADNPIRIQSMTTTDTLDIAATVRQSIELAEAGCEIVRITAPSIRAAKRLGEIRHQLNQKGCTVPLAADIHFLPQAAMEAVEHVEKIRVNPGNYADRKKFQIREYTEVQYEEELQRLHDSFSPLVKRCRKLGRAMRIGTNHGSLSDRILNRFGDTPLGMVESALEFIRIAESHGYHDIILSMKASNTKIMIQAYRLAVQKMKEEGMNYPLHLGVTEAGDGEDGRIKSAVGIGSLLYDGYGDTIRVSLTEDPVNEVPVARELAARAVQLQERKGSHKVNRFPSCVNPFEYQRRQARPIQMAQDLFAGSGFPPRLIVKTHCSLSEMQQLVSAVCHVQTERKEDGIEGLWVNINDKEELKQFAILEETLRSVIPFFIVELPKDADTGAFFSNANIVWFAEACTNGNLEDLLGTGKPVALNLSDPLLTGEMLKFFKDQSDKPLILALDAKDTDPVTGYRELAQQLQDAEIHCPIWIRNTGNNFIQPINSTSDNLLEASLLSGSLLCDGIGDCISIEEESGLLQATNLGYNLLQATRTRVSKTEFVACPSCGRTLFDLEATTQKVKEKTGHLKGVTIAVMGCIVNGPGEMADADFGYVGGAPGKINLYVGKECVQTSIPEAEAVNRLVSLIKKHQKWREPVSSA